MWNQICFNKYSASFKSQFTVNSIRNTVETVISITLVILVLLLFSYYPFTLSQAQGQTLQRCPDGYQRNTLGFCEPVADFPLNLQRCPDGYNRSPSGFCLPVTSSQYVNPYGYPTTTVNPVIAGEKNIERNNGKDFDIKDVFNDSQLSIFNDQFNVRYNHTYSGFNLHRDKVRENWNRMDQRSLALVFLYFLKMSQRIQKYSEKCRAVSCLLN